MDHFSLETENVHPIKIIDKENFNQWNEKQSTLCTKLGENKWF